MVVGSTNLAVASAFMADAAVVAASAVITLAAGHNGVIVILMMVLMLLMIAGLLVTWDSAITIPRVLVRLVHLVVLHAQVVELRRSLRRSLWRSHLLSR